MERLTMIDGCGNDELARCMDCCLEKAGADLENCGMCEEGWQRALKRLAAYEDTGLEPEEIKNALDVPMTNADRIRAMSDEELAEFVDDIAEYVAEGHYCTGFLKVSNFPYSCLDTKECCKKHVVEWLQQPAEDDGHA